jgi:hypothetical protein
LKNPGSHIIRTQEIEIHFENLDEAIGLQDRVADVFYNQLQPAMEKLFDEIAGDNQIVKLDRLEIDCGTISNKNWEAEWVENCLRNLRSELLAAHRKSEINTTEQAAQSFLFFLENGHFQWNNRLDSISQLEQRILIHEEIILQLKKLFKRSTKAAERLAFQFSENFRNKIIRAFAADNPGVGERVSKLLNHKYDAKLDRKIIDATILKILSVDNSKNVLDQLYTTVNSKAENDINLIIKELLETRIDTEKEIIKHDKSSEDIFISNAGLILLHPFFSELFEDIQLIKDNQWVDLPSQQKAAMIMQYLVIGSDEINEFDLALNKLLCGMEISDIINSMEELSEEVKSECDNLLLQVIKHWSVLKNTGIDAFRETFLMRDGKLSKTYNGWLLQVEQKGTDILLSHLPWGIGVIKTPWMKELIYVDWT